ncbi:MAG: YqeG family HAD IIIA-type phosphatase [Bacilli bacterium]|nr:YqeG family HAD IIIA-type phosphatase [Bacilli bacterium]
MLFKKFLPTYYLNDLKKLEPNDLIKKGFNTILCDLDNTIVPFSFKTPSNSAIELIKKMQDAGINFYIISNNHYDRVALFCKNLNIKYLYSSGKPKTKKVNNFIIDQSIERNKTIIIGDQLLTDIFMANNLKMQSLLVEPACNKDLLQTKPNRFVDKRIRNYFKKKNLLKSIKE